MKKIIEKIRQHGFDDYKIIQVRSTENQLYLLRDRIESTRTVTSNHYQITVYRDHHESRRKMRGEYKFEYKPGSDLQYYLEQAKYACALIMNRHYDLVSSASCSDAQALDARLSNPLELGKQIADTIYKNTDESNVYLSSAEIYLTRSEITLATSTGVEISKVKGLIEIETTLISKKGKEEQELNFELKRRNVDDLRLQQRLDEYKEHALNMLHVQIPRSGKANVIINASDAYALFAPIIFHSSGQAKDQGISRFNINQKIVENATNEFTLKSSGILPFGLYTEPFDADGIACHEHTLIDRGIFRKYWTTKRYADYLGVEPTGEFKNLIIEPVANSIPEFDSYYEIVQFSDLSPDPITGDLVAEIRLGYGVNKGQKIPVKGGSVAGNLFENIKHAYFADDRVFEGSYSGPRFIVLKDMSISGQ